MRVLLFGATGAAGGSVLRAALASRDVSHVTAIVRRAPPVVDGKLHVVTHEDFLDFRDIASAFSGIDTCVFALGVSTSQVPREADYRRITRDFAVAAAHALKEQSPDATFQFVSAAGTRPGSRIMWARVKAEAEAELTALVGAVCFRPGVIDGEPSASQQKTWYAPFHPLFKLFAPFRSLYVTGQDLGRAMLQSAREGLRARVLENRDIRDLADRSPPIGAAP